MAIDLVSVYNMTLSSLGAGSKLQSTTEKDPGAEQCNIWYESVRDQIMRAAPWPTLERYKRLGLLAERDDTEDWVPADPPPGWLYAYSVPSDYLWPRHITDYASFRPAQIASTHILATNTETPILVYTGRETNPSAWDVDLRLAIVHGLAAHIAKAITGKESDQVNAFNLAQEKINNARQAASNQIQQTLVAIPSWISARGYAGAAPGTQFIYPSAEFQMMGSNNLG